MPGFASTGFRFDTPPNPAADRGPPLQVIVHGAPARSRAGHPREPAYTDKVQKLRAHVGQLEVDRERAQARLVQMHGHALRARHIEESAAYRSDGISLCGSVFLGAVAGVVAGSFSGLIFAGPPWVIGAGAAGVGTTSGVLVASRKLYARCAREFHANRAGTEAERDQVGRHTQDLTRQVREARESLAAAERSAERLAQVDAAIRSRDFPVVLLDIIAEYALAEPGAAAALAPSAPA